MNRITNSFKTEERKLDPKYLSLLLIESDLKVVNLIKDNLAYHKESHLFKVDQVSSLEEGKDYLDNGSYDLVILALNLTSFTPASLEAFYTLKTFYDNCNILLLTQEENERLAVEALSQGAQDVFVKKQIRKESVGLSRCIRYCYERYKYITELENYKPLNSDFKNKDERIERLDKLIKDFDDTEPK